MSEYLAGQKLWKITREIDGYFYEIRLKGMVIDRIKINTTTVTNLKNLGVIDGK